MKPTPFTGFARKPDALLTPATGAWDKRAAITQLVVVWLVLVGKAYLLRFLVLGDANVISALVGEGLFLGALLVIVDSVFPDHRLAALLSTDAILSVAMLASSIYASYYGEVPTPALLGLAGQVPAVKDSLSGLVNWMMILFVIDVPLLLVGAGALSLWRRRMGDERRPDTYVRQPISVVALGFAALAISGSFGYSVTRMPDPIDGKAVSRTEGLLVYQVASVFPRPEYVSKVELGDPTAVQSEVDRLRGGRTGKRIVDSPVGWASGKNVIIIQVEALQNIVVGARVNGQEITPNINRLASQSYYFPNSFAQVGAGNTADAEFIVNSSLYPPVSGAASVDYADRTIPSLPRLMNDAGYDSLTFHANDVEFWNRRQLYQALGFSRYFDAQFFKNEDVIGMGPSDAVLFRDTLAELVKRDKEGKKFLAELVTLSAHRPFDAIPADRQTVKLPPDAVGTFPGNYVVAQGYTDRALGQFLDGLERSGLAEKSIIVLYGDHWGLAEDDLAKPGDKELQQSLLGRESNEIDLLNVPLLIHMPGQTSGETFADVASQIDVAPTLVDALGLDRSKTAFFGRDLFVRSPVFAAPGRIVSVGSYIDERLLFIPGATFGYGHAYDVVTKQPTPRELASEDKWQRMRETIQLSQSYAQSLPRRPGYASDPNAITPQTQ